MNTSLSVNIAGWPLTLYLDECSERTRARLGEYYGAFVVPDDPAGLQIRVHVEPGTTYIPLIPGTPMQVRCTVESGRLNFVSHFEKGSVDWARGKGTLVMREVGDPENFLRVIYACLCAETDGLLLHANGVIRYGKGYVFFGPSGSGKTTTARLSLEHTVLSDDIVIVRKHDGRFRVYGVPFRGDLAEGPRVNASADLAGAFSLVKDTVHKVLPIPTPVATAQLAACVPFVMEQLAMARHVTETCADLASHVPVRALHFRPDNNFWEVIDGLD